MTQPVTLYLRRETWPGPVAGVYTTYHLVISGLNLSPSSEEAEYLWHSLGLPDEDGEHRVKVVRDDE